MSTNPFLRMNPQVPTSDTHIQPSGKVLSVITAPPEKPISCMVQTRQGVIKAQLATSCLLQPMQGDEVLLATTESGCFILSILQREQQTIAELHFPQGVQLHSQTTLQLKAEGDFSLESASKIEVTGPVFNLAALKSRLRLLEVVAQINHFQGRFSRLQWLAEWAEQKAERFRQRFGSSDRVVQHHDLQKAGNLVQQVEQTASLRSEHTIIKAREDVQVDGKRIHMG